MRIIATLAALLAFATPAYPECLACWSLEAVDIELSSGEKMSGYLPWNDGWVFFNPKRFGLIEALTSRDPAVQGELSKLNLYFYPELLELQFKPLLGKRVAIKPPIKVDYSQIASILISSGVHSGYSGAGLIEYVPDAAILKEKLPRYILELSADLGDSYFVVYGESVAPRALLWHIARTQYGYPEPNIKVDGATLLGGRTAGPFRSLDDVLSGKLNEDEIRQFREFADEFHAYIHKKDSASASCRSERAVLSKRWRSLAKEDPAYNRAQSDFRAIHVRCNQIERAILDQYPASLGNKEQLSKLGVFQLNFAWD